MANKKTPDIIAEEEDQIDSFLSLKANQGKHFGTRSGDEIFEPDVISTGSHIFDSVLDGGFRGGSWARFIAEPECGKTSMSLCWGKQWQDYYKAKGEIGRVVYFNAEGRINEMLIACSGIDNTSPYFKIIDTNRAELIWDTIAELIYNNPNDKKYFFIVDSTDALNRDVDADKKFAESDKMSGVAAILSAAGKKLSLPFNRNNHFMFICSQVRDNMKSQHGGKKPSGGWSPQFYSSLIGTIKKANDFDETLIRETKGDKKSPVIGRFVNLTLDKTPNKKTGTQLLIPIKEDLVGGVWRAYEAVLEAESYGLMTNAKGRYAFVDSLVNDLKEAGIECETKFHGEATIRDYFDENPELVEFVLKKAVERRELLKL